MKVLSAESNLASATNLNNSTVVRVYNSDSSSGTITKKDAAGNTLGTITVPSGEVVYCEKQYTDTLEGGATLKASQIAYSNMMYYASSSSGGGGGGGSSIPTDDLEVYINPSSYSSGVTVSDSSGNSRTYILANGVVHNTSPNRFTLDGTNDYLVASSNYNITTGNATFVVWIKRNGDQNAWTGIFFNRLTDSSGIHFYDDSNKIAYSWNGELNTYSWQSNLLVADATWTMVAVSVNSSTAKAYRYTSSSTPSTATNTVSHTQSTFGNLNIGRDSFFGSRYFDGDIGHTLFYSSTLTDSQITDIYNSTKSTYGY